MIPDAERTWNELAELSNNDDGSFDPETVSDLADPAHRFLTAAIPAGAPLTTGVEIDMVGRIKLGVWLPFTARQILRANDGLVWAAEVGPRILRFVGADTLGPDGAHMQFKLYGRIPIVDATGPDVDRSAAGRLAAETAAWLPQALTPQTGATWTALDDRRATVTLSSPDGPIDVVITIDDHDRLVDIGLQRWNDSSEPARHEPFGGSVSSVVDVDGVRIAEAGAVGWGHDTPTQDVGVFFEYRVTRARFLATCTGAAS